VTARVVPRKRLFLTIPAPVVGCLRKDVVRTCHHQGDDGPSLTASLTALRLRACRNEMPPRTCLLSVCVTLSASDIA